MKFAKILSYLAEYAFIIKYLGENRACFLGNVKIGKNEEKIFLSIKPMSYRGRYVKSDKYISGMKYMFVWANIYFIPWYVKG
jgi:hypothetical protein